MAKDQKLLNKMQFSLMSQMFFPLSLQVKYTLVIFFWKIDYIFMYRIIFCLILILNKI